MKSRNSDQQTKAASETPSHNFNRFTFWFEISVRIFLPSF
jgi:hypothetical protein